VGLKTKLGMALVTSAAGAAMVAGGTFAIFTAQGSVGPVAFAAGTVTVNVSSPGVTPVVVAGANGGTFALTNLAPGDQVSSTVSVKNSGSLDEYVKIDTDLKGSLFNNNGVTGSNIDGTPGTNLVSIDASAGPTFATDNWPARYKYKVDVYQADGLTPDTSVTGFAESADFSQSMTSSPFHLPAGDVAVISYTGRLPISAHNDYQGATGKVAVQIDASQYRNVDGSNMNPDLNDLTPDGNNPVDNNQTDPTAGSPLNN